MSKCNGSGQKIPHLPPHYLPMDARKTNSCCLGQGYIPRIFPLTRFLNFSSPTKFTQSRLYGGRANVRIKLAEVSFGKRNQATQDSRLNAAFFSNLFMFNNGETGIKFLIAQVEHKQEILYERNITILVCHPSF